MKLFQYAVLWHPTDKQREGTESIVGIQDKLIVEVTTVLAKDVSAATLIAARAIPQEYMDRLSQIEVVVRPF